MDATLVDSLWLLLAAGVIAAASLTLKWRSELREGGWWSGLTVEGRRIEVGVDHSLCMGASSCVEIAPDEFHLDWNKRKSTFDPAPLEHRAGTVADQEKVFRAAQSCPYRAIYLRDADSGERVYP